jgi:hypothetical protein
VTKAWRALGGEPEQPVTAENFASFSEPGYAKLAESTTVSPYGAHACILTLEARVAATDEDSRRRFQRYWRATGPVHQVDPPLGDARGSTGNWYPAAVAGGRTRDIRSGS